MKKIELEKAPEINDTHLEILQLLEESEADNWREGVPGLSISELAQSLDLKQNTVSERVSELQEMDLVEKNKSEFSKKEVIIRPSNHYDVVLGNRKTYMNENGVDF